MRWVLACELTLTTKDELGERLQKVCGSGPLRFGHAGGIAGTRNAQDLSLKPHALDARVLPFPPHTKASHASDLRNATTCIAHRTANKRARLADRSGDGSPLDTRLEKDLKPHAIKVDAILAHPYLPSSSLVARISLIVHHKSTASPTSRDSWASTERVSVWRRVAIA